jgi:hypothetical protein
MMVLRSTPENIPTFRLDSSPQTASGAVPKPKPPDKSPEYTVDKEIHVKEAEALVTDAAPGIVMDIATSDEDSDKADKQDDHGWYTEAEEASAERDKSKLLEEASMKAPSSADSSATAGTLDNAPAPPPKQPLAEMLADSRALNQGRGTQPGSSLGAGAASAPEVELPEAEEVENPNHYDYERWDPLGIRNPAMRIKGRDGWPIWPVTSTRTIEVSKWWYNPYGPMYSHKSWKDRNRMWLQLQHHLEWYVMMDYRQKKGLSVDPQSGETINAKWLKSKHRDRMRGMKFFFTWVAGTPGDPEFDPAAGAEDGGQQ